jgi:hypothetical protein
MDFGKGVDTLQLIPRGFGVNDTNGSQPVPVLGGAGDTIVFQLARVESYEDFHSALNLDASISAVMGLFGGNVTFNFAEAQKFHSFSQYLVASITVTKAFKEIPKPQLDPSTDAGQLLSNGNNQRFAEEFGDMFVLGARMGGAYYAVLEFTAKTEEDVTNIKASLDAGEFGVFATSDKFSQNISSFKGNTSLRVKSFQTGGNAEGQETNIDAIIDKAKNFATELGETGDPFVALLQDYKSLRLPAPPNFIDIQNAGDVLANYATLRNEIVSKINDIEYIQLNAEQFVDVASFDLQGMLTQLITALNQLKTNASNCVNAIKACTFIPVTIPTVILPKRVATADVTVRSFLGTWLNTNAQAALSSVTVSTSEDPLFPGRLIVELDAVHNNIHQSNHQLLGDAKFDAAAKTLKTFNRTEDFGADYQLTIGPTPGTLIVTSQVLFWVTHMEFAQQNPSTDTFRISGG